MTCLAFDMKPVLCHVQGMFYKHLVYFSIEQLFKFCFI